MVGVSDGPKVGVVVMVAVPVGTCTMVLETERLLVSSNSAMAPSVSTSTRFCTVPVAVFTTTL